VHADKSTALQIKDLLTLCLADAIDRAMLKEAGPHWFSAFSEYDASPECKTPILRPNQASIHDCDMQALLKILRYREPYTEAILEHYGFFDPNDEYGNSIKKGHFQHLLNRLITDFRNRMEAHTRAADLKDKKDGMLYDYGDAVNDMLKLAEIFRDVKNKNGLSYHKQMTLLANKKRRKQSYILLAVVGVLVATCLGLCVWLLSLPPQDDAAPTSASDTDNADTMTMTMTRIDRQADGGFFLYGNLTNHGEHTITNINVADFVVKCNGKVVATKNFGILPNQSNSSQNDSNRNNSSDGDSETIALALAPGEIAQHCFRFDSQDLLDPNVSLDGTITCTFTYDAQ